MAAVDSLSSSTSIRRAADDLLSRYAWAIDDRDYDALSLVFTPSAKADYEAFTCRGVHEIIGKMKLIHHDLLTTQHLISTVLVEDEDATGAVLVRSHVRATLVRSRDAAGRVEVAASYRDVLTQEDDGWRISERRTRGRWITGNRSILPWSPPARTPSTMEQKKP